MAKNKNTFAKRKREIDKRAKAEAKRDRRLRRKQGEDADNPQDGESDATEAPPENSVD